MNDPALTSLLRLCARLDWDADRSRALADAAGRLTAWNELPRAAEAHGLAPLVSWHLSQAGIDVPTAARQELLALGLVHHVANRTRFRILGQILDAFGKAAVPVIVLKGAALAHLLYPSIALRPLSDIDLLIDRSLVPRALALLKGLKFAVPAAPAGLQLGGHHHLPAAVTLVDGVEIRVEIHINALTHDTPGSLTFDDLTAAPQQFIVEGRSACALGHADMLYHLCRHMAERAPVLRLIWVADVIGYASRYRDVIPWADVERRYPFVLNALSLVHLVTDLPRDLLEYVTPSARTDLHGVGTACKPISAIFRRRRALRDVWHDVFDPSDWWLRLYYELDDRVPLWWYRSVRHPFHVGHWIARRAGASLQRRIDRMQH